MQKDADDLALSTEGACPSKAGVCHRTLTTPYGCFWAAAVGLALESCAGEFRRFVVPPSAAATYLDAAYAQIGCALLAVLVLIVAFRKQHSPFVLSNKAWGIAASVCFSFGLAFYFQESLFVASAPSLGRLGYTLVVIAGYLYLFAWFDRLLVFGAKSVLMTVGASLVLRGLCQVLLIMLQQTPSMCLLVVLPLASLPFFLRVFSESQEFDSEMPRLANLSYKLADLTTSRGIAALVGLLVIIGLLAFLSNSSLSRTSYVFSGHEGFATSQMLSISANLLFGAILFGFALLRFKKMLLLVFFLAITALASFSSFTANAGNETLGILGAFALTCSRKCLDFAVVYPAFMFSASGSPQFRWLAASRLTTSVGSLFGSALLSFSPVGVPRDVANVITGIVLLALFITLIILFVCFDDSSHATAPGSARPAEPFHRPFKETLEKIAGDAKLTPTEANVLELIARGHNAESVRKELVISVNTAKTHIRNIYAKLGIHSQQELIALVNETKEEIVSQYHK